ncbi:MAG TPA: OsmC family protein [Terriglobales bacterium]|nr:OsmC family protein [Terriglobales bacterium]
MPSSPATSASATWTEGQRFLTDGSSGHAVPMDADRQRNSAPGPMEMVLRALCACSATDMVIILNKKRQPFTAVTVQAEAERALTPPEVFTRIHVRYTVRGAGVEQDAAERTMHLSHAKYCSVMAMVAHTAEITSELILDSPAQAPVHS